MEGNIVKAKKIKLEIEEQDGGYLFPQFGVHVIASTQKEARKLVKKYHGFDPDEEITKLNEAESDTEAK